MVALHHPPWAWEGLHPATLTWIVVYLSAILLMGGACLYAAARLVCVVDELYDARAELAQGAVDRERLRISRDCTTCSAAASRRCRSRATWPCGC